MDMIKNLDLKVFIIVYEFWNIYGGFWIKGICCRKFKDYELEELESVVEYEI